MNIIKRGYTLAEVLITLAVIGTIATVTLPSLQTNAQRAQVVPALQKAVNTLRNANQQIMFEADARTLSSACPEGYAECFKNVVAGSSEVLDYKILNVSNQDVSLANDITAMDNILYSIGDDLRTYDNKLCYQVYVDINGKKGPNTFAKDLFEFYIELDSGRLRPAGDNGKWNTASLACKDGENPKQKRYCTAAIIENGWQIKYKY